jgi:predicted protein tyrosine phosphatase
VSKHGMNKLANVHNSYQGKYHRALFLCSAGLLRSATSASIFSGKPYLFNTRNAGTSPEYALIDVSIPLIVWADGIYLMEDNNNRELQRFMHEEGCTPEFVAIVNAKAHVLNIPDNFAYRDPKLIRLLKAAMKKVPVLANDEIDNKKTNQKFLDAAEKSVEKNAKKLKALNTLMAGDYGVISPDKLNA